MRVACGLLTLLFSLSLSTPLRPSTAAQTPSGQARIAFVTADYETREMTLSLADPVSGAVTVLLNDGNFYWPVFSPDGRHLAFVGENPRSRSQNIYIVNTDGTDLHPLIPIDGSTRFWPNGRVAWSPDSTQIIYGVTDRIRNPLGFFLANVDGSNPERIEFEGMKGQYRSMNIAATADGSRLAFYGQDSEFNWHIYVANADGSDPQPISAALLDDQPYVELAWSPDGQHTLLIRDPYYVPAPGPLVIADGDGANATVLVSPPPNYINSVSWSPDGSQIAFLATETSGVSSVPDVDVYIVNADGSGLMALDIALNVSYVGTSWGIIPDDVTLPATPTSFMEAIGR
jgi:Tol biopolymer transport system component